MGNIVEGLVRIGAGSQAGLQDMRDIVIRDGHAFVCASESTAGDGLTTWDISDIRNISYEDQEGTGLSFARSVALSGDYAFVTGRDNGSIVSINISDPTNIYAVDQYSNNDMLGARGIAIDTASNYAYVSCGILAGTGTDGIAVFDISDPSNIIRVARVTTSDDSDMVSGGMVLLEEGNQKLYVSNYDTPGNSLLVYDISDPTNPTLDARVVSSNISKGRGIVKKGNYIIMASQANSTVISFDISDPALPVEAGHITNSALSGVRYMRVHGNRLFAACRSSGNIVELDVTDPECMDLQRIVSGNSGAYGLAWDDHILFVARADTTTNQLYSFNTYNY